MKPITQEWINKAESDWVSAQREARARKRPNYDLSCFAAQQCAEKYLKARLAEAGIIFRKTHDLSGLLNSALPIEPGWNVLQSDLSYLNAFAIDYRYPGVNATKTTARDALKSCRRVRKIIRTAFGLPV
ncbi:MAG: HEPN domain-containing protein [Blastocatellia bacterium]